MYEVRLKVGYNEIPLVYNNYDDVQNLIGYLILGTGENAIEFEARYVKEESGLHE